jgi:hypothetical protein
MDCDGPDPEAQEAQRLVALAPSASEQLHQLGNEWGRVLITGSDNRCVLFAYASFPDSQRVELHSEAW